MGALKKIIYNCRHATYLIEKRQEAPLSLKERVQLFIHLRGCSICRLFQEQSRSINQAMKNLFGRTAERTHRLDEGVKREMQERINERMPK